MNRCIGWVIALLVICPVIAQAARPTIATTTTGPSTTAEANVVDLLALINPRKDALAGQWTLRGGVLCSSGNGAERLQIPYEPPEEYDYEIHFVPVRGNNCIIQMLSHDDKPFIWVMGTGAGKRFTFHYLKGAGDFENRTTRDYTQMVFGHEYDSVVKVRRDGVKAYLDGDLVSSWDTDYSDVEQRPWWQLQDHAALGLACAGMQTEFRSIRVREISGHGKILRPAMPLAFRTVNRQFDDPRSWTVRQNSMHTMTDGRLHCEGNASISFNSDIPGDCRISFKMNVVTGPSPRIYFDGAGICLATKLESKSLVVQDAKSPMKPLKHIKGDPIPYKAGEALDCTIQFHAGHFELTVNGHSIAGDCQHAETLRLSLRGSTGDRKDVTDFSDFYIEPAAPGPSE